MTRAQAYDAAVRSALLAIVFAGCTFHDGALPTPDGAPLPMVGFVQPSTPLADEAIGTLAIGVALSSEPAAPVTVGVRVAGGTASEGDDYMLGATTLTLTSTEPVTVPVTILPDGMAEPNETIELELHSIMGATPGQRTHEITISANVLARVNFTLGSSAVTEAATTTQLQITLDQPSLVPVNVTYSVTPGSATSGSDFTTTGTPVTFAVGETMHTIPVTILQDTLDEFAEDLTVTLTGADAAIVGAMPSHALTINDDGDPAPTVYFSAGAASQSEGNTQVPVAVTLSGPSGKPITVPFSMSGASTANNPADFTYASTTALSFAPESTTAQMITVIVADDLLDEDNETVVTALDAPTNATLSTTMPVSHTLTIVDDDLACYGPNNHGQVCLDRAPSAPVTLTGNVNTNVGSLICEATQPSGWAAQGQPAACFVKGTTVTINNVQVTGSRPLVIVSSGDIVVQGILDAASHRTGGGQVSGPGSPFGSCSTGASPDFSLGAGAGGGAGGTFMTAGGDGGTGDGGLRGGGSAGTPLVQGPNVLRAGCDGQQGGRTLATAGAPGRGGGVVYLLAQGTLSMSSSAVINVSGSGASGSNASLVGGSGAGSGGMIRLWASSLSLDSAAKLIANGGGGSSGASGSNNSSGAGSDPDPTMSVDSVAAGGTGGGGKGGDGYAIGTAATDGAGGSSGRAGGGGGGGAGYIGTNLSLGAADVSGVVGQ